MPARSALAVLASGLAGSFAAVSANAGAAPQPEPSMSADAARAALLASSAAEGNAAAKGICLGVKVRPLEPAQTAVLEQPQYLGSETLGWWNMPVQQQFDVLQEQREGLDSIPWGDDVPAWQQWPVMKAGSAAEIMHRMFNATRVDGVFDKMPEKMRGVFWMRGNGQPEELTVAHYGLWYPEEDLMLNPMAPYTWAWPGGKPRRAPKFGMGYSDDFSAGMGAAWAMVNGAVTMSYKWSDKCEGKYCRLRRPGRESDMTYAYMQAGAFGNLSAAFDLGKMVPEMLNLPEAAPGSYSGAFTLQELPNSKNGSLWKRTCHWGTGPTCAFIEFGSYDLVKVVDGDGRPVQPHYDDFLDYMGDVPLFVWTGWESEQSKSAVASGYTKNSQGNYTPPVLV